MRREIPNRRRPPKNKKNSHKKKKKKNSSQHSRAGYPFATLVDFASDGAGFPIFNLSPLAMHTRNLLEDPRACLVVEMPGWSGLANARVTIFGEVGPLPEELQEAGRELFAAKQAASEELLASSAGGVNGKNGNGSGSVGSTITSNGSGVVSSGGGAVLPSGARKSSNSQQKQRGFVSGNATLFRMHRISDIYFVGGFGTVSWVDPAEYAAARPDAVASLSPRATLSALNEQHSQAVARLLSAPDGSPADDAAFISVDARGADVRLRRGAQYGIERLAFSRRVESQEEALRETAALLAEAEANGSLSSSSVASSSSDAGAANGAASAAHASDPVGKA